jgi:hypothetical protein
MSVRRHFWQHRKRDCGGTRACPSYIDERAQPVARHVFISYSRGDGDYVAGLVVRLQAEGLNIWTDQGVRVGTQWVREIERKIIDCAAFVPVMSERSNDANWVDREIDLAEEQQKPIAPLLLSGRPFFRLRHLQYEDVRDRSMPSGEFISALRAMTEEGRQVSFRGRVPFPHSPPAPSGVRPGTTSSEGHQGKVRRVAQHRWMAPAWGVAVFLLFFVGTLLIMRSFDSGGDGGPGPTGVAVGSCVSKTGNNTLAAVDCAREGAQMITQFAPAGDFCANPRDVQHFFRTADRSSICVESAG